MKFTLEKKPFRGSKHSEECQEEDKGEQAGWTTAIDKGQDSVCHYSEPNRRIFG